MQALVDDQVIELPAAVLAERERLGLDTRDEVWDGILHMNPPPLNEHSRVQHELFHRIHALAAPLGMEVRLELGHFDPAHATPHNFRVPDLVVFRPEVSVRRGVEGPIELAMEVRSPGDDSFKKIPFYEAMGVGEVLIVHRDSTWVRRWVRRDDVLVEVVPSDGHHRLACVPLALWSDGTRLFTESGGSTTPV